MTVPGVCGHDKGHLVNNCIARCICMSQYTAISAGDYDSRILNHTNTPSYASICIPHPLGDADARLRVD